MSKPKPPLGMPLAHVPQGFPGRVTFLKSAANLGQAPHSPTPEICFCGRSNVGKSTLLNSLCNRRQLARVSSTPGRTRLINFFDVQDTVTLVDLPGYGFARAPKAMQADWGRTIQDYLADRPQLCLTLLLIDIRRDARDEERNLLEWFRQTGRPCLIVATKADKVPNSKQRSAANKIAEGLGVAKGDVVPFSSLSGLGRDVIWGSILAHGEAASADADAGADAGAESPSGDA